MRPPRPLPGYWADEDAFLEAGISALADGRATIEEVADLDLAVVTIASSCPVSGGHRFGGMWAGGLHPMALYNATDCFAVLVVRERQYELVYRYETWVQYQSRRPRPRVDLRPLADELSSLESSGTAWVADGPSELTPGLRLEGQGDSDISPGKFRQLVEAHIRTAPSAWDPSPAAEVRSP